MRLLGYSASAISSANDGLIDYVRRKGWVVFVCLHMQEQSQSGAGSEIGIRLLSLQGGDEVIICIGISFDMKCCDNILLCYVHGCY